MKGVQKYERMNLEKMGRQRFIFVFFLNFADPTILETGKPTVFFSSGAPLRKSLFVTYFSYQ